MNRRRATHASALDNAMLLLDIVRRLPRRRFVSSAQLLAQLNEAGYTLTLRTVQRHLEALCQRFPVECDTRSKPYGYRWLEGAAAFNLPALTASEALLLELARSEAAQLLPAQTLHALAPLFATAQHQLGHAPQPESRWLTKVRRIPESQPLLAPPINAQVFELVTDALNHEHKLRITYRNALGRQRDAVVWPLGLAQQGVRLYLVCRFEGHDDQRILALPRILQAQATGEPFDYPPDFNLARYDGDGHFGISHGRTVRLHFTIDKPSGQHLVESPLSADQQVVEGADDLSFSATVVETELLHRWLRGWGERVRNVQLTPDTRDVRSA